MYQTLLNIDLPILQSWRLWIFFSRRIRYKCWDSLENIVWVLPLESPCSYLIYTMCFIIRKFDVKLNNEFYRMEPRLIPLRNSFRLVSCRFVIFWFAFYLSLLALLIWRVYVLKRKSSNFALEVLAHSRSCWFLHLLVSFSSKISSISWYFAFLEVSKST